MSMIQSSLDRDRNGVPVQVDGVGDSVHVPIDECLTAGGGVGLYRPFADAERPEVAVDDPDSVVDGPAVGGVGAEATAGAAGSAPVGVGDGGGRDDPTGVGGGGERVVHSSSLVVGTYERSIPWSWCQAGVATPVIPP